LLLLALAGLGAFLSSAVMLARLGSSALPARYFIAAALGYLLFLALVRGLARLSAASLAERLRRSPVRSTCRPRLRLGAAVLGRRRRAFQRGWGRAGPSRLRDRRHPPLPPRTRRTLLRRAHRCFLDSVPDADEAWPLALIALGLLMLAAGMTGAVFVIWASPALFAEVLLDAAVVGAVYRRARRRPRSHWLRGVFRRTWMPAATLCLVLAIAGFALQITNPGAHSLGAVVRAHDSSP
jgi:hypothetical protein